MISFANQVVLITGAGQGIGKELAVQLASEGAAIGAIDLDMASLESLERELAGKRVARAVADVGDREALTKAIHSIRDKLGPVDVLIANAGIGFETSALAFRAAEIEKHFRVNLLGVVNSIEAVLPGMIERKSGHLVAISSVASFHGIPKMAGYCASKSAVNVIMDALRVELKPLGIFGTTVCPGWIRTRLTEQVDVEMPQLLEVADAARRIIEAIRRRRPFVTFPKPFVWRVAVLRWLPTRIGDWLVGRQYRSMLKTSKRP